MLANVKSFRQSGLMRGQKVIYNIPKNIECSIPST